MNGPTCEGDVDECATAANNCDTSPRACVNTPGSFRCECPSGYSTHNNGVGADGCQDINECGLTPAPCDPLAGCTNTGGSFNCGACPPGYSGGGASGCTDIDECSGAPAPCASPATCHNTQGAYSCDCPTGYRPNGTGGCNEINECDTLTPRCAHGQCVDELNAYRCICDLGWEGPSCAMDVHECTADACAPNASCSDQLPVPPGSVGCTCNPGFTGDGRVHDGSPGCVPNGLPIAGAGAP